MTIVGSENHFAKDSLLFSFKQIERLVCLFVTKFNLLIYISIELCGILDQTRSKSSENVKKNWPVKMNSYRDLVRVNTLLIEKQTLRGTCMSH